MRCKGRAAAPIPSTIPSGERPDIPSPTTSRLPSRIRFLSNAAHPGRPNDRSKGYLPATRHRPGKRGTRPVRPFRRAAQQAGQRPATGWSSCAAVWLLSVRKVKASFLPDILVPILRMFPDERLHQVDTILAVQHFHHDAVAAEQCFRPHERPVLPDDDLGNAV